MGRWVNVVLSNLKRSLDGAYHAFKFAKYAHRYLAETQWRLNRRFDLTAPVPRLLAAAVRLAPWSEDALRDVPVFSAEVACKSGSALVNLPHRHLAGEKAYGNATLARTIELVQRPATGTAAGIGHPPPVCVDRLDKRRMHPGYMRSNADVGQQSRAAPAGDCRAPLQDRSGETVEPATAGVCNAGVCAMVDRQLRSTARLRR